MKALSLRQPWASMIAVGRKTVETRTWNTRFRGPFLIVSSKKRVPDFPDLPYGQAIATATLIGCRRMKKMDVLNACVPFDKELYSWILKDIRSIIPFPMKGQLGWYNVDVRNTTVGWLYKDYEEKNEWDEVYVDYRRRYDGNG